MAENKHEVLPGTLNLLVLKTLATLGPLHGYGIARRIEQVSGDLLELNQGTIYPALLKLEQMRWIKTKGGTSENNCSYACLPRRSCQQEHAAGLSHSLRRATNGSTFVARRAGM